MRFFMNIAQRLFEATDDAADHHHGIANLPSDVKFRERQLKQMIKRGNGTVFRAVAEPGEKLGQHYVTLHPANPGNALPYEVRPDDRPGHRKAAYYDPELADLETLDKGEQYLERTYARPKRHLQQHIEPLDEKNVMYRGMSGEEYADINATGRVESRGEYNIGDQQAGLTYWATDARSAETYAASFAPMQWKPTIGHPCFVVAAEMPGANRIRKVQGTGEHEVGVIGAISADQIIAVWKGVVYDHISDPYDFRPVDDWYDRLDNATDDGDTHRVRYGGYSHGLVWLRIK
jgi:hypothetical protein